MMNLDRKIGLYSSSAYFIILTIIAFVEYPQVDIEQQNSFVIVKSIYNLCFLPIIYCYLKNYQITFANYFLVILVVCQPPIGQWYRPTYEYSLMPCFALAGVLIPVGRRFLYSAIVLSSIAFIYIYSINYDKYMLLISKMYLYDNMISILSFVIAAVIISERFTTQNRKRDKIIKRYGLVGTHASAIIHDLKNILTLPRIQLESVRADLLNSNTNEKLNQVVAELENSLNAATNLVLKFNQISILTNTKTETINLKDTISDARFILQNKLKGIFIEISGEKIITADSGLTLSLVLNILTNAADAMLNSKTKKIYAELDEKKITFRDTGPGFSSEILKEIKNEKAISDKLYGSGNGLMILREACLEMNASVSFYNHKDGGAVVEINF